MCYVSCEVGKAKVEEAKEMLEEEEEEEKEKEEGGEDEDEMDRWMALEYHQKAQVLDLNFILL